MLASKGRLKLPEDPGAWFQRLLMRPGVHLAPMGLDILFAASFLPGPIHNDPADRIIVATARSLGLTIVTGDRAILSYAARGHVLAVAC
jgi:PIN domain nuclease of toxin-antitoxin system